MANSIVFQDSASQLKTAIFGYDSNSKSYKSVSVSSSGAIDVKVATI
ncbi:conserved hypothetical protein, partial [Clostridium carboxidivorans P7]